MLQTTRPAADECGSFDIPRPVCNRTYAMLASGACRRVCSPLGGANSCMSLLLFCLPAATSQSASLRPAQQSGDRLRESSDVFEPARTALFFFAVFVAPRLLLACRRLRRAYRRLLKRLLQYARAWVASRSASRTARNRETPKRRGRLTARRSAAAPFQTQNERPQVTGRRHE